MQWQAFKENIAAPCYFRLLDTLHIARHLPLSCSGDAASEAISRRLFTGEPCMMCRYGSTEVRITEGGGYRHKPYFERLKAKLTLKQSDFVPRVPAMMATAGGFFTVTVENMERFTELMLANSQDIDIPGAWCRPESTAVPAPERVLSVPLIDLEPYFAHKPWSRILAGKKAPGIHLGGALQILFGIAGKRWDRREPYRKLYNDFWCRPGVSETPKIAKKIEGGCCC